VCALLVKDRTHPFDFGIDIAHHVVNGQLVSQTGTATADYWPFPDWWTPEMKGYLLSRSPRDTSEATKVYD
jgi:hypothetical protein